VPMQGSTQQCNRYAASQLKPQKTSAPAFLTTVSPPIRVVRHVSCSAPVEASSSHLVPVPMLVQIAPLLYHLRMTGCSIRLLRR
jgi:hypothetical protein